MSACAANTSSEGKEASRARGDGVLGGAPRGAARLADSYFLRREDLGAFCGGEAIAQELLASGLLRAVVRRHRLTIFRRTDAAIACEAWARAQEAAR